MWVHNAVLTDDLLSRYCKVLYGIACSQPVIIYVVMMLKSLYNKYKTWLEQQNIVHHHLNHLPLLGYTCTSCNCCKKFNGVHSILLGTALTRLAFVLASTHHNGVSHFLCLWTVCTPTQDFFCAKQCPDLTLHMLSISMFLIQSHWLCLLFDQLSSVWHCCQLPYTKLPGFVYKGVLVSP
jgi:hypothetical protein